MSYNKTKDKTKKISRTKTTREEHREAEDDTQMTGPDRPEGEKLREPEGENRLEYTAFKHPTSHRPRRAPRKAPQTKQNREK